MQKQIGNIFEFMGNPIFTYDDVTVSLFTLLKVLILLGILQLLLYLTRKLIKYQIKSRNLHQGDLLAVYQIIKYLLIVVVFSMILSSLGINTTILLTSSAALLVGVGMGMQNIFKDIMSGMMILFGKVVRIGDIVQVGDILGKVEDIHLRTSRIITRDDINIIVPNSKFVEENVINWTLDYSHVRLILKVGVAYGSDVELVKKILLEAASNHKEVISDPSPKVRFSDFGESSLDFQLLIWTKEVFSQEFVKSDIRYEIDKEFRKHNIVIPFPQRVLWNKSETTN